MKSYIELLNENEKLKSNVNAICGLFTMWAEGRKRVVYIPDDYKGTIGQDILPLGMLLAMIRNNAFQAINKQQPKPGTWDEMFPIDFLK